MGKNIALLSDELQLHIFVFVLISACLEILYGFSAFPVEYYSKSFLFLSIFFFFFYAVIGYVFDLIVSGKVSVLFSVLPSILLFLLLKRTAVAYAGVAAIVAAVLRLSFALLPKRKTVLMAGSIVLGGICFYLWFSNDAEFVDGAVRNLTYVFAAVLILAAVQEFFYEKRKDGFPFYFFVILSIFLAVIPKSQEPINWNVVLDVGRKFVESVSYYMPDIFGGASYNTGYSSFNVTGGKLHFTEKIQISLSTFDMPYYTFEDENGTLINRRKVLYLAGGRGSEKDQIVSFINMLHSAGVNKQEAKVFSEVCSVGVDYRFLKTYDEIAPINALSLLRNEQIVEGGKSTELHKTGYHLRVKYLSIDYGNAYLADIIRNSGQDLGNQKAYMSFSEACDYFEEIYGVELLAYVSEEEYNNACEKGFLKGGRSEFLSTGNTSSNMQDLAKELTENVSGDYDKCKSIENYLRQYTYSTDIKYDGEEYDMSTPEGAGALAEKFLFEDGEGYCVHFTSSMLMLLRLSGIPARVSVGYRYVFPFEKADSYEILGKDAHAWPEAYIENVGWVPFEPTSGFRSMEENTWNRVLQEAPDNEKTVYPSMQAPKFTQGENKSNEEDAKEESIFIELVRVVLPVFASIIGLLVVLMAGTVLINRIVYNMASADKKFEINVEHIKKEIRKKSADDFADRGLLSDYEKRVPDELRDNAKEVFGIYYRMLYGGSDISSVSEEEVTKAEALRAILSHGAKAHTT